MWSALADSSHSLSVWVAVLLMGIMSALTLTGWDCWDCVTSLGCPFGNSRTRVVWSAAPGLLMTTSSLHVAGGVWCRRHARSSWRWYLGAEALVLGPWGPCAWTSAWCDPGSWLSNKYASVGLKQSFYDQRKPELSPWTKKSCHKSQMSRNLTH